MSELDHVVQLREQARESEEKVSNASVKLTKIESGLKLCERDLRQIESAISVAKKNKGEIEEEQKIFAKEVRTAEPLPARPMHTFAPILTLLEGSTCYHKNRSEANGGPQSAPPVGTLPAGLAHRVVRSCPTRTASTRPIYTFSSRAHDET